MRLAFRPLQKPSGLLVDSQDQATFRTDDAVTCPGRMNHQGAGLQLSGIVSLRATQNQNVLEAAVFMQGNTAARTKAKEPRRRPVLGQSINPMDFDPIVKTFPFEFVLPFRETEQVRKDPGRSVLTNKGSGATRR